MSSSTPEMADPVHSAWITEEVPGSRPINEEGSVVIHGSGVHWFVFAHAVDVGEPAVLVFRFALYDFEVPLLDTLGHRSAMALAYCDSVDGTNRRYFGRGSGEKDLVSNVKHFPRDDGLDYRNTELLRNLYDGVARDTGQDGGAERRSHQFAATDQENVLTRPFAYVAGFIERDA